MQGSNLKYTEGMKEAEQFALDYRKKRAEASVPAVIEVSKYCKMYIMGQSACLALISTMVCSYGFLFNLSKLNEISHSYKLDQSIFILRVVGRRFFIFIQILIGHSVSKQWRPW